MSRSARTLLMLAALVATSGATCVPRVPHSAPLAPAVFALPPTIDELLYTLNTNTSRVTRLRTENATVSSPGLPGLRAEISLERPRRFRLRGKLLGPAVDLGSNDELIWFWANNDPEDAVYFARHGESRQDGQSPLLPVQPEWLIEAFGLVEFTPRDLHEGPVARGEEFLEIRSLLRRGSGDLIRSVVVHATYGWVVRQQIHDTAGQLLAAVNASNHRYYEQAGISLPHRIGIELPPARVAFQLEVAQYDINPPVEDAAEVWMMPPFAGHRRIDLSARQRPVAIGHPNREFLPYATADRRLYRPRYRTTARSHQPR